MRRWFLALALALSAGGCGPVVDCADGTVQSDRTCVPDHTDEPAVADTDDTDVDSDVEVSSSHLRIEWSTTAVPNANVVTLACDGRRLMREENFTIPAEHNREFDVTPDETCQITLSDVDGGLLPPGRLIVCSQVVQSWEAERGRRKELPEFTAYACVAGCIDEGADNFDPAANLDDGSCTFVEGCTDPTAVNYQPSATKDDGTCSYGGFGLLEVDVFTDASPADTTLRVVCGGAEALHVPTENQFWAPWTTQQISQVVEAGHQCDVFLDDSVGNSGPSGILRICGEVAFAWSAPAGTGRPYSVLLDTIETVSCSGCTDALAKNFDAAARVDDGSCAY